MEKTAEQIIVDILLHEMPDLTEENVWIRNQTRKIPPTAGLYITVGMTDSKGLSGQVFIEQRINETTGEPEQFEVQRVQTMDNIMISIMSRDNSALTRRWEVIAALNSFYSKQQQESNYFKISRLPNMFIDGSSAEGGSNLNRYIMTVGCFVWYRKETNITNVVYDYYDDFNTRVDDAVTIGEENGLIEFEIAADTALMPLLAAETGFIIVTQSGVQIELDKVIYNGP